MSPKYLIDHTFLRLQISVFEASSTPETTGASVDIKAGYRTIQSGQVTQSTRTAVTRLDKPWMLSEVTYLARSNTPWWQKPRDIQ
jgi:hypothetical protein